MKTLMLLFFVVVSFGTAFLGGRQTLGAWYKRIEKPVWNPPSYLFPLIVTPIYAFIALAGWVVWCRVGFLGAWLGFFIYFAQMGLGSMWMWLFFGKHLLKESFWELVGLWCVVGMNVWLFWRADAIGGMLLLPYWAWLTFSLLLNYRIWQMNSPA